MKWDQKFFRSTRGQIVVLLRRAGRTVEELAQALDLTDNGVRAHLATLERDGIVRQRGVARRGSGGGKPAYLYELAPEAEDLFPKAYEPVLEQLLDALSERLGHEDSETLLRLVGHRMAKVQTVPPNGLRTRLEAAVAVLNELGGLAELKQRGDLFIIRGYSCPLASVAPGHPEVCSMAESLLTELVGAPVHERCERGGERPRCCFEVIAPEDAGQR